MRAGLAKLLLSDHDILMLDEPTASLDPDNTKMVEGIIMARKRDSRRIHIMVTHNLQQARALSDIVIFLYEGKIIEISDAESFFVRPAGDLTRRFVKGEVY